jgi:hypothetical protein
MMTIPAAPPAQAPSSLAVTWAMLGKFVMQLATSRAHADVTIIIKDGEMKLIRVTQTCLPSQLPR